MEEQIALLNIKDILVVIVPSDPHDETITMLQEEVLEALQKNDSNGVILDISTVEIMDSFFARTLMETSMMIQLMGGVTVIAGMQPSVAITTIELGLDFGEIITVLDVDSALEYLKDLS